VVHSNLKRQSTKTVHPNRDYRLILADLKDRLQYHYRPSRHPAGPRQVVSSRPQVGYFPGGPRQSKRSQVPWVFGISVEEIPQA
jgi:hypothetical protein